jgi:hypothetical protein
MRKYIYIITLLLAPQIVFCQSKDDSLKIVLPKNIFRVIITQPLFPDYETSVIVAGNYERGFGKNLTLSTKIGLGTSVKKFGPSTNPTQTSFHLYSSAEFKHFFLMKNRIKKQRTILKYSGPYIGVEQNLFTNPIALINQTSNEAFAGSSITFLNLGYQKQVGKLYLAAHFGVNIWGVDLSKQIGGRDLNTLHGGVGLGFVF